MENVLLHHPYYTSSITKKSCFVNKKKEKSPTNEESRGFKMEKRYLEVT